MSTKNLYAQQARKKHFLHHFTGTLDAKGNIKNTAVETGKDLLVGVIGGGLAGAAIGKPSLLIGLVTTGVGHYTGSRLVQLFGIGLMASNGFQKTNAVNGLDGMDGLKDRMLAYRDSFAQKFYVDKFMKKKAASSSTPTATNGIGEVQYFNPDSMNGSLAALDDIEQQLADSAMEYQQMNGNPMDEMGEIGELAELEERLY